MSSATYLASLQAIFTRYGMSTYVAFGNVGNFLAIAVFSQREQRRNPCSLYLLSMAIFNLICLDVGIIPIIFSLDHLDITTVSIVACKLQFYIRHASFQMMRTCKVLACIDRFALSSMQVRIRSFSQRHVAIRLITISTIFWALAVIFFSIVRTIENGSCNIYNSLYTAIYTIYYLIFAGVLPPFLIIVFSVLVMRNLSQMRARIQPTRDNQPTSMLNKRDRDLIKMVLIEVIIYITSTTPFSAFLVYKFISDSSIKSKERKQIESFINYMTQSFIMYFNTALPFYIYAFTSPSFRRQCKRVIVKFYAFLTGKEIRRDDNDASMTTVR